MDELYFYLFVIIVSLVINISCGIFYTIQTLKVLARSNHVKNINH
ncbi:MAG: hypothetical protein ACLRT4_08900 [Thomasclavelia sp.]